MESSRRTTARQILIYSLIALIKNYTYNKAIAKTAFTSEELERVREAFGIVSDDFRRGFYWHGEIEPFNLFYFARTVCRFLSFEVVEKVAEFRPEHGNTYKAIKKAIGANVFGRKVDKDFEFIDIYNIQVGDRLGKVYHSEHGDEFSGLYRSNRKAEQTRSEKLAAVGITISRNDVITAINADVLEALAAERADVERQRKEWEEAQKEGKKAPKYKTSEKSEEPQPQPQTQSTEGAQPQSVEGVELVELEGGRIAVVGNTYEHRETLKAFGGWWNRRAQRWEFRTDKAQNVREWLGMGDNAHTEPQSDTESEPQPEPTTEAKDEPQPEPQPEPEPTTEAKDEQQPEPTTEEPTEGAKAVTISEGLAGAFVKVAAIVAAVVMVATSSAAQPEPEPQSDKGGRIVFAVDDTPDLQEIHTETRTDTQPEPATATGGTSDRLDALHLARLKAQSLTEENEHTQALFAELEALAACGVDVSDIVRDLHALDAAHVKRGYITAGEIQMRQFRGERAARVGAKKPYI